MLEVLEVPDGTGFCDAGCMVQEVLDCAGCCSVLLVLALLEVHIIAYHYLKEEIKSYKMI